MKLFNNAIAHVKFDQTKKSKALNKLNIGSFVKFLPCRKWKTKGLLTPNFEQTPAFKFLRYYKIEDTLCKNPLRGVNRTASIAEHNHLYCLMKQCQAKVLLQSFKVHFVT